MISFSWKILAVLALALVASGCGSPGPRMYKAGGTVTHNGQPVEGATVTFFYEDANFASGVTDAAGKFQLAYMGRPGGAVPGKCSVAVAKTASAGVAPPPPGASPDQMMKAMQDASAASMPKNQGENAADPKTLLPAKYASPQSSGLRYEIKTTEQDNDFKIELKDE